MARRVAGFYTADSPSSGVNIRAGGGFPTAAARGCRAVSFGLIDTAMDGRKFTLGARAELWVN